MKQHDITTLFEHFNTQGELAQIKPFGSGHINDTYLATTQGKHTPDYIFQRINTQVFKEVDQLMSNIVYVTDHIRERLLAEGDTKANQHCLTVIKTATGRSYYCDENQDHWACYLFIAGQTHDLVTNTKQAYSGGKAYGRFISLLSDIDPSKLHETIPQFHHLTLRLDSFEQALAEDKFNRRQSLANEVNFIRDQTEFMLTTLQLGEAGKIPLRVTHNDTKFNNVLLDQTGDPLCVIDLDTVMPGYLHYDYSDAVRTGTTTAKEDEPDLSKVSIDIALFKAFTRGFLQPLHSDLTEIELSHLSKSASLLPYTIGLRFLTDHLNGDTYFKTNYAEHNLVRARNQLQLVKCLRDQQQQLDSIVEQLIEEQRAAVA